MKNYLGHGANSQLGPVLPTALPSGHIFASSVQACGCGCNCGFEQADSIRIMVKRGNSSIFFIGVI